MRSYVARSGVKEYETTLPLKEGQLRDRTPIRGGDAYLVFDDLDWDWTLVTPLNVSYENEYGKTAVSAAEIFEQEGQNKVIRSLIPATITETLSPLTASLNVTVNGKTTLLQTTISMNGIDAINDLTIGDLRAGKVTVYGDIYDQKNGERNISQIITNLQSGTLVVSVKETEIKYGRNNSATVAPETGWFDNPPAATEGEYLWTRTKWIYSNGTSKSSYSVVKDGKSSYLHTAWANSSDGTVDFSTTSSVGRSYIGTYSDSNEAGSSTPSKYKWVKTTGTAIVGVASKNLWEPDRLITNLTNRGLRFQIDNPVRIHSLKVYSTESGYIDLVIKKSSGTVVFNSSYQVEKGEQTLTLELQLTDVGEYTITKTDSLSLSYHTTMESEFPFNSGTFKITASTGDSYTKTRYYYFYDWVVSGEGVIAKTPDLWFIGADGYWYLNGVKTAKPSQGSDGQTSYLHTAWANNSTGTSGFSTTVSTDKTYLGTYTDYTSADSTDPTKYTWSLIKGDKGDPGEDGRSAYEDAVSGGYSGTYEDFMADLGLVQKLPSTYEKVQTNETALTNLGVTVSEITEEFADGGRVSNSEYKITQIEAGNIKLWQAGENLSNKLVTLNADQISLTDYVNNRTTKITNKGVYTGEVTADQVKTGLLKSTNGLSEINLDNGRFNLGNGALQWNGLSLALDGDLQSRQSGRFASVKNGQVRIGNLSANNTINELTGTVLNINNFTSDGNPYIVLHNADDLRIARTSSKTSDTIGAYWMIFKRSPNEIHLAATTIRNFGDVIVGGTFTANGTINGLKVRNYASGGRGIGLPNGYVIMFERDKINIVNANNQVVETFQ